MLESFVCEDLGFLDDHDVLHPGPLSTKGQLTSVAPRVSKSSLSWVHVDVILRLSYRCSNSFQAKLGIHPPQALRCLNVTYGEGAATRCGAQICPASVFPDHLEITICIECRIERIPLDFCKASPLIHPFFY